MLLEITSTFPGKVAFITANCFSPVCHMWIVTLYKLWFIDWFFQKHGLTISGERRDPCPQNANPDANSYLASTFQNLPQGGHLCQVRPQGDHEEVSWFFLLIAILLVVPFTLLIWLRFLSIDFFLNLQTHLYAIFHFSFVVGLRLLSIDIFLKVF